MWNEKLDSNILYKSLKSLKIPVTHKFCMVWDDEALNGSVFFKYQKIMVKND